MKPEVRKARSSFQKNKPDPGPVCDRCGMTQEEHNARGKGKLQIHHTMALKDHGMAGNDPSTYDSLCYWCHREWHTFWEYAGKSYDLFKSTRSFLSILEE